MAKKRVLKSKENLIQSNNISRSIYTCSPIARKIIALAMIKYMDDIDDCEHSYPRRLVKQAKPILECTINEFLKLVGMPKGGKSCRLVRKAVVECSTAIIKLEDTEEHYKAIPWFMLSEYNLKRDIMHMELHPLIADNLLKYRDTRYSLINIKVLGQLQSLYSMRYYEIALSYRNMMSKYTNDENTWTFRYSTEKLRTLLDIGDKYNRETDFIMRTVQQPIDALNKINPDFVMTFERTIYKRRTIQITFICKPTRHFKQIPVKKNDSRKMVTEKLEINKEHYLLEKYSQEFMQLLEYEKTHPIGDPMHDSSFFQNTRAMLKLVELHQDEYDNL